MPIDGGLAVELLALGLATGFLAGMLGIGGGMLQVPFMTIILSKKGVPAGIAIKMAIATSMATIVFTSLSSLRAHHRRGAVRWDLVRGIAPGIVGGGLMAGAGMFALIKGPHLAYLFALFLGVSALQMLRDRKPQANPHDAGPARAGGGGRRHRTVSGLLGAGGAFVAAPFMTWCNVPMHTVVATSAALGFPVALASTAGYLISGWDLPAALPGAFGYLYLPAVLIVSAASVSMAPLGARAAHATDVSAAKAPLCDGAVRAGGLHGLSRHWRVSGVSATFEADAGQRQVIAAAPPRFCQRAFAGRQQFLLRARGVRKAGHAHRHAEAQFLAIENDDLGRALAAKTFHARMCGRQPDT